MLSRMVFIVSDEPDLWLLGEQVVGVFWVLGVFLEGSRVDRGGVL
jgi:hypothetical protein